MRAGASHADTRLRACRCCRILCTASCLRRSTSSLLTHVIVLQAVRTKSWFTRRRASAKRAADTSAEEEQRAAKRAREVEAKAKDDAREAHLQKARARLHALCSLPGLRTML